MARAAARVAHAGSANAERSSHHHHFVPGHRQHLLQHMLHQYLLQLQLIHQAVVVARDVARDVHFASDLLQWSTLGVRIGRVRSIMCSVASGICGVISSTGLDRHLVDHGRSCRANSPVSDCTLRGGPRSGVMELASGSFAGLFFQTYGRSSDTVHWG